MQQLSPYAVLQAKLLADLAAVPNPDKHKFDQFFVEATTVLAAYGDQNQSTNSTLCARALLSWSDQERGEYLAQVDVPGRVYSQMQNPDPWPSVTPTPSASQ